MVQLAPLVRKEREAQPVLQAQLVPRDHKVRLVQREPQDLPEVELAHLDLKVQLVQLVRLVRLVRQVQLVRRDQLELQVLREQRAQQVQREQPARQVLLGYRMLQ